MALWRSHHAEACPGIATVKLGPRRELSYALALLNHRDDQIDERLLVIKSRSGQAAELVAATRVVSPYVVWRAQPGVLHDRISGKVIHIHRDAIIYEKMEASATAYYVANGKFHSVVTSN